MKESMKWRSNGHSSEFHEEVFFIVESLWFEGVIHTHPSCVSHLYFWSLVILFFMIHSCGQYMKVFYTDWLTQGIGRQCIRLVMLMANAVSW